MKKANQELVVDIFGKIWRVVHFKNRALFSPGENTIFTGDWEVDF